MLDIRLISGKSGFHGSQEDEYYWLGRLSETKRIMISDNAFPLEFAISLFNKDYADLHISGINIVVEIMPAGLAALQSHRFSAR